MSTEMRTNKIYGACHSKTHKIYGSVHYSRAGLEERYEALVEINF
jgi:hypothetical protein